MSLAYTLIFQGTSNVSIHGEWLARQRGMAERYGGRLALDCALWTVDCDSLSSLASTSGSRTSTQRPWISRPAILCLEATSAVMASVSSYSPRGDFSSFAVKSNRAGLNM